MISPLYSLHFEPADESQKWFVFVLTKGLLIPIREMGIVYQVFAAQMAEHS
jgi:hypothetical protein